MNSNLLNDFFNMSFENSISEKMMYYNYKFEYDEVLDYVNSLLSISFQTFYDYIIDNYNVQYLTSCDVLQFSNFYDCTSNICRKFKESGDNGYKFLEIGKMLEDDGFERKKGAYLKYGENHAKSAHSLGLLYNISTTYYLSPLGYIFDELSELCQIKLIVRLILRNRLIQRLLYKSNSSIISYKDETGFLSESTRLRRKSNVKYLVNYIINNADTNIESLKNIVFD